jgi:hypothetical protein
MLFRKASDDIDNGEFVYGRKIICFFPDPAVVPRNQRRSACQKFAKAILGLRIRPPFDQGDEAWRTIFPKTAHISGFSECRGMSSWWMETVCTASYSATLQAMKAWRADVADWKQNKGVYKKAA